MSWCSIEAILVRMLHALTAAGIEFVIRVPKSGTFDAIQVFQDSGGDDYRVLVHPSPELLELASHR